MNQVTFAEFASLASRRHWTAEALALRFRGVIESPLEFFNRVLQPKNAACVIPYRSVIQLYSQQAADNKTSATKHVTKHGACACGCGEPVFDRRKWARPGCKKRIARQRVTDPQNHTCQVSNFVSSKPGQNKGEATLLLAGFQPGTKGPLKQDPMSSMRNGADPKPAVSAGAQVI
jgi:hypothetical protein